MALSDLYLDYNITLAPDGHKHHRQGWINVPCPFCTGEHDGYHLGFNVDDNYFYCWRCGHHPITLTIAKILHVQQNEAKNLSRDYRIRKNGHRVPSSADKIKIGVHPFKLPSGVSALDKVHRRYLEKRNFDPDQLIADWKIQGTSPTSSLDNIFYKFRILVPIYWEGKIVSFQCRDYTNKQEKKYMACPQKREVVHHKHLLYGHDGLWNTTGICVEGVFDVWRLGGQAFSTLGIGYTSQQVRLIAQLFKKVFIIFDPEKQARTQAKKLQEELQFRGVEAINYIELDTDPADLSVDDAQHLLKQLGIW